MENRLVSTENKAKQQEKSRDQGFQIKTGLEFESLKHHCFFH